jgi:acyl-CoA hydrolase
MHIACDVYSRKITGSKFQKTTHCIIVFVCIDSEGKPQPVKKWVPKTEEDIKMEGYAKRLMELRKTIEVEMEPFIHR